MLTKIEKETIINFNEMESDCEVYTFNGKLIRRLDELCDSFPSVYKKVSQDCHGACSYVFSKKRLRVKFHVPMTGERKIEAIKRIESAREKRRQKEVK